MRVALVSPYDYASYGGVVEHVAGLAAALQRLGHAPWVFAPASAELPDRPTVPFVDLGRPCAIGANGSIARILLSWSGYRRLRQALADGAFDVVHLHEPMVPLVPLAALLHARSVTVGTFHASAERSVAYRCAQPLLRRLSGRLHGRIAVSRAARDFAARYLPGEYRVIPNGVDFQAFAAVPGRVAEREPLVLYVGRLERRKGVGYLLRAWEDVRRRAPGARLVVAGGGRPLERYRRYAAARGWPEVCFPGVVSRKELLGLLRAARIVCAPSTGQESFGLVLLQAMAAGVPVVASRIAGYVELIDQGGGGILVPPCDVPALAAALAELLSDPRRCVELGQAGQQHARQFDWDHVASGILEYYFELHSHRAGGVSPRAAERVA